MNFYNKTVIDQDAFAKFQIFHGRLFKRCNALNYLYYGLALGFILFVFIWSGIHAQLSYALLGLTLTIIWVGLIYTRFFEPKRNFKKHVKENRLVTYHFFPNSFKILSDAQEDALRPILYTQIVKLYELPTAYYIYFSKRLAYIISKSGFSSEADRATWEAQLKDALGKNYIVTK